LSQLPDSQKGLPGTGQGTAASRVQCEKGKGEIEMSEHPILFTGEMVRAILDGRKTQTRRTVKPEHLKGSQSVHDVLHLLGPQLLAEASLYCPYGQAGDQLWVKETFTLDFIGPRNVVVFRVDEPDANCKWKPSIFMRRIYSRITLEITNVRVERLHEISEEDARAEGVKYPAGGPESCYRMGYSWLWESINGQGSWDKNPWVWVIEFKKL
jgi:hypothetical protein